MATSKYKSLRLRARESSVIVDAVEKYANAIHKEFSVDRSWCHEGVIKALELILGIQLNIPFAPFENEDILYTPTLSECRKILWKAIDKTLRRYEARN